MPSITRGANGKGTVNQVGGSPVGATWSGTTILGSLLHASISSEVDLGTVTPPDGAWVLALSDQNGAGVECQVWTKINAAAESGLKNWAFTGSGGAHLILQEYKGAVSANAIDGTPLANHGTSANPASGTLTTTHADDVIAWSLAQYNTAATVITFSSPLNSFVITNQQQGAIQGTNHFGSALVDQLVSATSGYTTGVTSTVNATYASVLLAITADAGTPPPRPVTYFFPHDLGLPLEDL